MFGYVRDSQGNIVTKIPNLISYDIDKKVLVGENSGCSGGEGEYFVSNEDLPLDIVLPTAQ